MKIKRSKIVPGGHFSKVKNFRFFSKYFFFGLKFSAKNFFFLKVAHFEEKMIFIHTDFFGFFFGFLSGFEFESRSGSWFMGFLGSSYWFFWFFAQKRIRVGPLASLAPGWWCCAFIWADLGISIRDTTNRERAKRADQHVYASARKKRN